MGHGAIYRHRITAASNPFAIELALSHDTKIRLGPMFGSWTIKECR
jgi:hypothetical protein